MNKKQRIVLIITAVVLALMLLFPPFRNDYGAQGSLNAGYSFILTPPGEESARVDARTLIAQTFSVVTIGGILWFALKD